MRTLLLWIIVIVLTWAGAFGIAYATVEWRASESSATLTPTASTEPTATSVATMTPRARAQPTPTLPPFDEALEQRINDLEDQLADLGNNSQSLESLDDLYRRVIRLENCLNAIRGALAADVPNFAC